MTGFLPKLSCCHKIKAECELLPEPLAGSLRLLSTRRNLPVFRPFRPILLLVVGVFAPALAAAPASLEIDGQNWGATELFHESFADESWHARWQVEGDAQVEAHDGRLNVVTRRDPATADAATIWWKEPLPADVLIEFTAGSTPPADDNNAANLNLFVHARELDGSAYRFGRSGSYGEYHKIPNYIFTLTGGFQEGWARARRNPGFNLASEDRSWRSEVGRSYRFRVVIAGGRVLAWIDGKLVHDFRDPEPLPGGHFALRTWRSRVWWSDVRVSALTRSTADRAASRPWFRSGFERGVELRYDEPTRARDQLSGRDATTGFDWSTDLPAPTANFFYLVRHPRPSDFVRTELRDTEGHDGKPTRALRMEVRAQDPTVRAAGILNRSEFSLFKPDYRQAYTRYWMKLQDNYLEVCPRDHRTSWRMFFELKEPDSGAPRRHATENRQTGTNNYRISCYVRRKPSGELYWHVRGEAPQPFRQVDWDLFNDEVPVPLGKWFKVEVFFRHADDGLFWLAIDGRQVALRHGRTQHPDRPLPIGFWSPFKLYLSPEWLASGPNHQWIDDVEFWPDFPGDATPRDDAQANRSTFLPEIADETSASSPGPKATP